MTFKLDEELAQAVAPLLAAAAGVGPAPAGDWEARRTAVEAFMVMLGEKVPPADGVSTIEFEAESDDGSRLGLRWYARRDTTPGSAVLYIHGGGMILGSVDIWGPWIAAYVAATGVPMLAVSYRYAPEYPHPRPVEDCYVALQWLADHAAELGVDPARIAVMGDSAGGGLAAAVALLARERGGPALARQILIYAMLDDRTRTPDPAIVPFASWGYDDNLTGWGALLGDAAGGPDVSQFAAPARASDLSGLPSAYIEVGELDIFRDEDIEYARRLGAAGISTELHVRPGATHGFDAAGRNTDVGRRALADRARVLTSI